MKYKVGDEVLIKAKIITGARKYFGVEVEDNRFDVCEDNIVPVTDMSAEEAWEIATRIFLDRTEAGFRATELAEIFGDDSAYRIMYENTPQQAKDKIEAWENEKEIKRGDEVVLKDDPNNDEYKFFVTCINKETGKIGGWSGFDGGVFSERDIKYHQKTGRHIDIDAILRQIGGNER